MDQNVVLLMVLLSGVLVYADAHAIGAGKHRLGGLADTSDVTWGIGTALLWIIVLPLYLITRPKILAAHKAGGGTVTVPQLRCAVCDELYNAQYDRCPRCAKADMETPQS